MKKLLFVILYCSLFLTPAYSQTISGSGDKIIDLCLVHTTPNLELAIIGLYHNKGTNFTIESSQKMEPVGKGVLFGFVVGTSAGILTGYLTREGKKVLFGVGRTGKEQVVYVSLITAIGSFIGTGIGALLGFSAQDNSGIGNSYVPRSEELPFVVFTKTF